MDVDLDNNGAVTQGELNDALDVDDNGLVTTKELAGTANTVYKCQDLYYSSGRYVLLSTLGSLFMAGMCVATMFVRMHLRKQDNIPATVCAGLDDCCCAVCCLPCVQCQMMRHLGLTGERGYKLFSRDGISTGGYEGVYQV